MKRNTFVKSPAKLSKSIVTNFAIREIEQNGRKVWEIASKEGKSEFVVLYLHGGAYMGNISKQHWDLIEQLSLKINAAIVIPDYPLVPESTCVEAYKFIEVLYARLLFDFPEKRIIFMGDSAGGGFALGFVQQLRNKDKRQPDQVIVFSPWLDVTMSNPNIELIKNRDKLLSIKGLKSAGEKYAGNLELKDYRVSPIYGDLDGLCLISIFTGTNDILNADAQQFKKLMKDQQIHFNYFEYPDMFHDWVIIASLKESGDVINKVFKLINEDD